MREEPLLDAAPLPDSVQAVQAVRGLQSALRRLGRQGGVRQQQGVHAGLLQEGRAGGVMSDKL